MKTDLTPDDDFDWPPYELPAPQSRPQNPKAENQAMDIAQDETAARQPSTATPPPAQAKNLPIAAMSAIAFPNHDRAAAFPAFISRSALFGAFRPGHAAPHAGPLKSAGNYELRFEGERLSMFDKRVWEAIVKCAKSQHAIVTEPFDAILSALAKDAGVAGQSGPALARVRESLRRLATARIQIEIGGSPRGGSLLLSATKVGHSTRLQFDAGFAASCLGDDIQFETRSNRRNALKAPFAQWLHDFLSTHEPSPQPFTLGYLRELCGYVGKPRRFAATARAALAELAEKCPELVAGWSIDDSRRNGANWRLTVLRGPERPFPVFPAAMKNKWPAPATASKRRGGVEL